MITLADKMALTEQIQLLLESRGAMKATELATDVCSRTYPKHQISGAEFIQLLIDLTAQGEIIEIEYIRPDMPGRMKSVYFPKGTKICFRNTWLIQ
jgi:hypothetical protein